MLIDKLIHKIETNLPFFGQGKSISDIGIDVRFLLLKKSSVECPNIKNKKQSPIKNDVTIFNIFLINKNSNFMQVDNIPIGLGGI